MSGSFGYEGLLTVLTLRIVVMCVIYIKASTLTLVTIPLICILCTLGGHINGPERLLIRRRKSEGGAFNWPRSAYENFPNFPKIQANFYRCQKAFYIIPKKPPNIMQSKSTQNTPPTPLKKTRKPN